MGNPCKELYNCNHCCEDTFIWMTMAEFAVFSQAWLQAGLPVLQARSKQRLIQTGREVAERNTGKLFYASNRTLDEHLSTGKYKNTKVLAIFYGLCLNNEAETGNCAIEEKKPKDCKDFEFEGARCLEIQLENGITANSFIPIHEVV